MKKISFSQSDQQTLAHSLHLFTEETLTQSNILTYSNKEWIHHAGTPLNFLYVLLQGKAKIVKIEENGKQSILQFLTAGDFIGELSLVQAETDTKDIRSMGETICLAIPFTYAEQQLLNDNQFLRMISQYIGKKVLSRTEQATRNQHFAFDYRLARLLLEIVVNDTYDQKHTEIAEYLGISYRHLLHTWHQFYEQGLASKQNGKIKIHRQALEAFVAQKK